MSTDLRRYDIDNERAVTPGEVWQFDITVTEEQEDGTFDPAASFASYDDWNFYILDALDKPVSRAIITLEESDGITVGTAPDVTVEVTAEQSADVPIGRRAYEFWATVNSKRKRLRFGSLPVVG